MTRGDGRIEPGQKLTSAISARAWNRAQQAADIVLKSVPGTSAGPAAYDSAPYAWVYAKSVTACSRWDVLKITGVEITPTYSDNDAATRQFQAMPVLTAEATSEVEGKACVALEPIAAGKIGRVAVCGAVQVKKENIGKVGNGNEIWSDTNWALVVLGGDMVRLGKTTSAWAKGTSQSIELWNNGDPLEEEISNPLITVTAYNRMYDVAACVWVLIAKEVHGWYLVEAATPEVSSGCAAPNIGGHDLTTISGYVSNKKQALTHDENACLQWVDIEECA